jgi:hypothetical protein
LVFLLLLLLLLLLPPPQADPPADPMRMKQALKDTYTSFNAAIER